MEGKIEKIMKVNSKKNQILKGEDKKKKFNPKDMTWNKISELTWANSPSMWLKLWGRDNLIERKEKKIMKLKFLNSNIRFG